MTIYVIRNREGRFFHAKGYGGHGSSWVEAFESARLYTKLGAAKSRVTFFRRKWPEYGTPEILAFELDLARAQVLDMTDSTAKSIAAKQKRELKQAEVMKARKIAQLQEEQIHIQQQLAKLTPL